MRTRIRPRAFSLGVRPSIRSTRRPLAGLTLLTGLVLSSTALAYWQNRSGDTPKADSERVGADARKSTPGGLAADSRSVDLRANKTLVLINVTVTDPLNRFVTGLEREHFRLFEDKVEQQRSEERRVGKEGR